MKKFKVLMFDGGPTEPYVAEVVTRRPQGNEVLVHVLASGICHSL